MEGSSERQHDLDVRLVPGAGVTDGPGHPRLVVEGKRWRKGQVRDRIFS